MFASHTGELAALLTAVLWTVTSLAFESASKRVGSLAVNLIRLVLAAAFLTAYNWIARGIALPVDATAHNWIWLSVSGLVGFALGDLCLFRALVVIGARLSLLLMALVPPMTALIGWLLMGEILSARDWIGMGLTVGGVAWVVMERKKDANGVARRISLQGVLLGLGGAFGQATGLVLSKYAMRGYDAFAATQIRVFAGIAGFALMFVFIGWWPKVFAALEDRGAMARTCLGATTGPFLGVSFSLIAVRYTEAGVAAAIMALVPVLVIPPTVILYKERVSLRAVLGACIAICGAGLLFL